MTAPIGLLSFFSPAATSTEDDDAGVTGANVAYETKGLVRGSAPGSAADTKRGGGLDRASQLGAVGSTAGVGSAAGGAMAMAVSSAGASSWTSSSASGRPEAMGPVPNHLLNV